MGTSTRTDQPEQQQKPRILVIEQHALFAEALRVQLRGDFTTASFVIDARTSTTDSVLNEAVLASEPDLAVVCLELGPLVNAEAVIRRLVDGGVAVVAVTATRLAEEPALWGSAFRSGASGVVSKMATLRDLSSALTMACEGAPHHDQGQVDRLVQVADGSAEALDRRRAQSLVETLSVREREVLGLLMVGMTPAEIARRHVVSEATVRTQVRNINTKLGVASMLAAVALAHAAGLTPPGRTLSPCG